MAKRKPKGVAKLKKDLWKQFALWTKLKYSDDGRWCSCYTCGNPLEIGTSGCQAGHWLPKGGYSVHYFNPDNVRPQCYRCNVNLGGNAAVFERALREEIGEDLVEDMYHIRHAKVKRTITWYQEQIEHYKAEIEAIS